MPGTERKIGQAKKAEGDLDPAKKGNESDASESGAEVEGRGIPIYFVCPKCGSGRVVVLQYEGEWVVCSNCDYYGPAST